MANGRRNHKMNVDLNLPPPPEPEQTPSEPTSHPNSPASGRILRSRTRSRVARPRNNPFLQGVVQAVPVVRVLGLVEPSKEESPEKEAPTDSAGVDRSSCFECNICFETASEPVVSSCGHLFCWPCIYQWMRTPGAAPRECPVCKGTVTAMSLTPIYGRGTESSETPQNVSNMAVPPRPSARRIPSWREAVPHQNPNFVPRMTPVRRTSTGAIMVGQMIEIGPRNSGFQETDLPPGVLEMRRELFAWDAFVRQRIAEARQVNRHGPPAGDNTAPAAPIPVPLAQEFSFNPPGSSSARQIGQRTNVSQHLNAEPRASNSIPNKRRRQ